MLNLISKPLPSRWFELPDGAAPPPELAAVSTDGPTPAKRRRSYSGKGEDQIAPI